MGDPIPSWSILFKCDRCKEEMMDFYGEPADVDSALNELHLCVVCHGQLRAAVIYEQLTMRFEVGTPGRWLHEVRGK